MKAQARLSHPTVSCIARRVKAVRSRFCKSGVGRGYLTQLRKVWFSIVKSSPRLYGFYFLGLQSPQCSKMEQAGLRNLKTLADNRRGTSQSGFLFIRNLSRLFMGAACSCDLSHGFQCDRISQNCNAAPTRLRNGRAAFRLNTLEANHA